MANLFTGQSGLRTNYFEANATDLGSATDAASAFELCTTTNASHIGRLANDTAADLVILVVHPEADRTASASRLKLLELPAGKELTADAMGMLSIDPSTKIFLYVSNGTVGATEKFRLFLW